MKVFIQSLSALLLCGLTACGGGGGGLTTSNGVSTMSGAVIDGLIENAKVCLDVNGNLLCDAGEPSTTTDKDGKYAISYNGSVDGMHVIAEVTADSKDADDLGKTIAQAGKEPFNLASPAVKPEVVTPLTTLVTHAMVADPTIKSDAEGLKKAEDTVRANTGLKADLLGNNFVDKKDNDVQNIAKVIAVALGDVKKEMATNLDAKKSTDSDFAKVANTDLAQKTIQTKSVSAVTTLLQTTVNSEGKLNKSVETAIADNKKATSTVVSGQVNNIVVGTKTGEAVVSDAKQIFGKGIIIGSNDSGRLSDGVTRYSNNLQVEYLQGDPSTRTIYNNRKVLYVDKNSNVSWQDRYQWGKKFVLSKNNEWINDPEVTSGEKPTNGDITFEKNCVTFKTDVDKVDANEQVCFTQKDLSGKKIIEVLADFCDSDQLKAFPKCDKAALFKSGSYAYDITFGVTNDRYRNSVDFNWDGYNTTDNKKTITAFIDATSKFNQWTGNDCNTGFKVKSYDASSKKGVMQWSDASAYSCDNAYKQDFVSVEETAFEVKMFGSIEMLILDVSTIYNKNNNNDGVGQKFIFNYMSDASIGRSGIYQGELTFKNTKRQMNFSDNVKLGTKETLDSFLEGLGAKAFPYPTTPVTFK